MARPKLGDPRAIHTPAFGAGTKAAGRGEVRGADVSSVHDGRRPAIPSVCHMPRQREHKLRPLAIGAFEHQISAMRSCEFPRDVQAEALAALGFAHSGSAAEALENPLAVSLRQSRAGVGYGKRTILPSRFAVTRTRAARPACTSPRFRSDSAPPSPHAPGPQRRPAGFGSHARCQPPAGERLQIVQPGRGKIRQIKGLAINAEALRIRAGQQQQILDQPGQAPHLAAAGFPFPPSHAVPSSANPASIPDPRATPPPAS